MFILGLQGSPRENGNTNDLLSMFMQEAANLGAITKTILPHTMDIKPCRELIVCEKKGFCPIKDDMENHIYALIKRSDIIVLASPVFFYNIPAQTKALIDRCQMFWGRKYKLKLEDPNSKTRQGFLLSCGASQGKKLFEGIELTAKVFFDAISANYKGALTYKHVEEPGQIACNPSVKEEIKNAVQTLCKPDLSKKKILFFSRHDACRGQMGSAFLKVYGKSGFEVFNAGDDAAQHISKDVVRVMEEKNIDLKYLEPVSLSQFENERSIEMIDMMVFLDEARNDINIPALKAVSWNIPSCKNQSLKTLRIIRDKIESKIKTLISSFVSVN